jgi:predicted  nucleic acid-binding Zn-ribbon protein
MEETLNLILKQINEMRTDINGLSNNFNNLRTDINDLRNNFNKMDLTVDDLRESSNHNHSAIEELRKELRTGFSTIRDEMNSRFGFLHNEMNVNFSHVHTEMKGMRVDVVDLKAGQKKLEHKLDRLNSNMITSIGDYTDNIIPHFDGTSEVLNKRIFNAEKEIENIKRH